MEQNLSTLAPRPQRGLPDLHVLAETELAKLKHPVLDTIYAWVCEYLCGTHAELGRGGPVCPFVPGALQKRLLFATLYQGQALDIDRVKGVLLAEMERFIEIEPVSGNEAQFKAVMVLFPDLPLDEARAVIDAAQEQLQKYFVPHGLMVGEFHAGPPPKGGLWNRDFRPLQSPVPMLAIRHMVPTDILFLKDNRELFHEYVKIYGNAVPDRFRAQYEEAARRFGVPAAATSGDAQGAPRIMKALAAADTAYRVHCHDDFEAPIRKPADFARALGYPVSRITKTLFLRSRGDDRHCLVVCGMDRRVDLLAISARLGTGRLELASLDELQRLVGHPPTSVTPIAVEGIPVFVDADLLQHPTVLTGSGVPRVEIEIAPGDLVALSGAKTMPIS